MVVSEVEAGFSVHGFTVEELPVGLRIVGRYAPLRPQPASDRGELTLWGERSVSLRGKVALVAGGTRDAGRGTAVEHDTEGNLIAVWELDPHAGPAGAGASQGAAETRR